jgi:hypothetical protein
VTGASRSAGGPPNPTVTIRSGLGPYAYTPVSVAVHPTFDSSAPVISTTAWWQVVSGSVPGNANPAGLRTVLRPPSQPTIQPARNAPWLVRTVTAPTVTRASVMPRRAGRRGGV